MVTIYEDEKKQKQEQKTVSENEKKKQDTSPEINEIVDVTPYTEQFLAELEAKYDERKKSASLSPIKVSEVFGRVARIFEKVRNTVEYKGEHLLRRNATERILKRLVWEQGSIRSDLNTEKIANKLIKELIIAKYLPNNLLPETKIKEVQKVIEKYIFLLKNLNTTPPGASISKMRDWLWGVASSEIEDVLDPSNRELYVRLMYSWFNEYFDWKNDQIPKHEKEVQIYLAIHRALPRSDDEILRYHLLVKEVPEWNSGSIETLSKFIEEFPRIYQEIEDHINYSGKLSIYRKMQKHAAAFEIFKTLAEEAQTKLKDLIKEEEGLEEKIREVCEEKYNQITKRVNRGIVRSIIYIFITKVLFVLALEVPYEIYKFGEVRYLPLGMNIMVPPIMMLVIGLSIRTPGEENTQAMISRIKSFVYGLKDTDEKRVFSASKGSGKSTLIKIFEIAYSILFIFVFGGVSYLLLQIGFSLLGVVMFFVFLSLVLLFAYRIRSNATQLNVESENEGVFSHLFNYLTLPFLNVGYHLSETFSKFNLFAIILDFIIEAPLKSVIGLGQDWTSFIKEKKEEVVEMPE